jgi:HAD superfamily hydrolase (TIGR01509 family)
MTPPRGVVFDMDGLMFNTEDVYWIVGSEILRRRGCQFTQELADAMMGRPPKPAFEVMIGWHSLDCCWEELARESEETFIQVMPGRVKPMPGLLGLLDALESAGIPKAIGTSSSRALVDALLPLFDLGPRFSFILSAEDIVHGKPHPEIYLKAAERLGLTPPEVLVLEDSENGCLAAAAAGTLAVAVPGEHSSQQDFSAASMRINTLADPRLYEVLGLNGKRPT